MPGSTSKKRVGINELSWSDRKGPTSGRRRVRPDYPRWSEESGTNHGTIMLREERTAFATIKVFPFYTGISKARLFLPRLVGNSISKMKRLRHRSETLYYAKRYFIGTFLRYLKVKSCLRIASLSRLRSAP